MLDNDNKMTNRLLKQNYNDNILDNHIYLRAILEKDIFNLIKERSSLISMSQQN